jgi:GxxExxY protein
LFDPEEGQEMKPQREQREQREQRDARLNALSEAVIGAAIMVHRQLGPGLLESAYEACLCYELAKRRVRFERQKSLPVRYDDLILDCGYRLDLLVERELIVELKAVERITDVHKAQGLTYLKLSGLRLALLLNFNVEWMRDGIKRLVNPAARQQGGPFEAPRP